MLSLALALLIAQTPAPSFEPPAELAAIRASWPKGLTPELAGLKSDPSVIWYSHESRPMAFGSQDHVGDGSTGRMLPTLTRDAVVPGKALGDGNHEFPWRTTGGIDRAEGVTAKLFLRLPPGRKARVGVTEAPPVHMTRADGLTLDDPGGHKTLSLDYPPGTVSGEILYQTIAAARVPFEVRVRAKGKDGEWMSTVYRPFPTSTHLSSAIKSTFPGWQSDPALAALVRHCESPGELPVRTLGQYLSVIRYRPSEAVKRFHLESPVQGGVPVPEPAINDLADELFKQRAPVDTLPAIRPEQSARLLRDNPFLDSTGLVWAASDDGARAFAPTADRPGQVVPKGYLGAYLATENKSCNACHDTAGRHVFGLQFHRYWYGSVRGGDGVFSFPWWDERSVSPTIGGPRTPAIDPRLSAAGLMEWTR
jgi:hypothetical protein